MADPEKPGGGFKRAEAYGRLATGDDAAPSLRPLYLAGGLLVAATIVAALLGAPFWVTGVFILIFIVAMQIIRARIRPADPAAARTPAARRLDAARAAAAGLDPEDAARRLDAAEAEIAAIEAQADGPMFAALRGELAGLVASARQALDGLADDPSDLARAQKFLRVLLPSARAAVEKFAALGARDSALEARMRSLIGEMTQACATVLARLSDDDRVALEVEIDVLSERLKAER